MNKFILKSATEILNMVTSNEANRLEALSYAIEKRDMLLSKGKARRAAGWDRTIMALKSTPEKPAKKTRAIKKAVAVSKPLGKVKSCDILKVLKKTRIDNVLIKDGVISACNLDYKIEAKNPVNIADGVYPIVELIAGLNRLSDNKIEDYPTIPQAMFENPHVLNLNRDDIEFSARGMSKDEVRYYLNGLYVCDKALVSTDGHRMFYNPLKGLSKFDGYIVPRAVITLALESEHSEFMFKREGEYCQIITPEFTITSKLIDGTYPDYTRVMQPAFDSTLEDIKPVHFELSQIKPTLKKIKAIGEKFITLYEGVEKNTKDKIAMFEGESVGYNTKYLETMPDNSKAWIFNSGPSVFKQGNRVALLMPIRI